MISQHAIPTMEEQEMQQGSASLLSFTRATVLRRLNITFFSLLMGGLFPIVGQEVPSTPSLTPAEVRARFEAEAQKFAAVSLEETRELKKKYIAALFRAEQQAKQKQDLDAILLIRAEMDQFDNETPLAKVVPTDEYPPLRLLQVHLNQTLEGIESREQQKRAELAARVRTFTEQQVVIALKNESVELAVQWRDLSEMLEAYAEGAVTVSATSSSSPSSVIPKQHVLTLWNQTNGRLGDRGTDRVTLTGYANGEVVWKEENVKLRYSDRRALETTFEFFSQPLDELLVEIVEFHKLGGGLSEIELKVGREALNASEVSSSSEYDGRFTDEKVVDGITSSEEQGKGYWLLKNNQTGWIRLKY